MSARTVSLVLSSGGARGLAHIGVIQWLEQNGFEIRSVAGASMGALVGGIYAAGGLESYAAWVTALQRMDVVRLLDLSLSRGSLFKGLRVIRVLRELIGDCAIESLPVDFTAVATDLDLGREIWLRRGSLFDAIQASIAIPTIFAPVVRDGRVLVDGGLVNPVPIAPTLNDTTDLTVVVNVNARSEQRFDELPEPTAHSDNEQPFRAAIARFVDELQARLGVADPEARGLFEIISKSMDTMQTAIARQRLAAYNPDAVIEIPRNACAFHEFYRARELISLGHARAAAALTGLASTAP